MVKREHLKKIVWAQAEMHTKLIKCYFPLTATSLCRPERRDLVQDEMQFSALAV